MRPPGLLPGWDQELMSASTNVCEACNVIRMLQLAPEALSNAAVSFLNMEYSFWISMRGTFDKDWQTWADLGAPL